MEMRQGNLWKKILVYSIPLMFNNLLQVFFNLADVAVVGKFAGPTALGGVGSTTLLCTLMTGFMIGLSNGVNALTALFIGADEHDNESKIVHTGFILCLGTGIFVLFFSIIMSYPILHLMGTKDELMSEALSYFRLYMLGAPAVALYNYGNAILSAAGDTKKPLKYLTFAGFINILLNLFFVIVCGMTAAGVALASIIAQCISCILVIRALLTTDQGYRLIPSQIHFNATMFKRILKIGVPSAIQYSLFAIANLFVQGAVNTFDYITVEGNSAAMNADSIVYDMMAAFYTASTSFTAQNYGARQKKRVAKTYLITTFYSFSIGLILGLLLFINCRHFLLLFTSDENVIAQGAIRVSIMSLSYCFSAFMDNATAACRGLGKTIVPTAIIIMGTVGFRIIWIYTIFAHFHTLPSLYLLYIFAWLTTALVENIYLYHSYRKVFT